MKTQRQEIPVRYLLSKLSWKDLYELHGDQ